MTQTMTLPEKNLLRVDEVAGVIESSDRHIRHLIESGKLRAINIGSKNKANWRIYRESVLAFLEERDSFNQVERKFR